MAAENKTKEKAEHLRILVALAFFLYLILLFYFLFLAESFGRTAGSGEFRYNLTLFHEIRRYLANRSTLGTQIVVINLGGNIVAFMPFGFLLPLLNKRQYLNPFLTTLFGFFLSACVELLQLCFQIGSFDVDDILLNTVGAFLGAIIYYFSIGRRKKIAISKKSL